jgi:hypothetical protein
MSKTRSSARAQCAAELKDGSRCRTHAAPGSAFCAHHERLLDTPATAQEELGAAQRAIPSRSQRTKGTGTNRGRLSCAGLLIPGPRLEITQSPRRARSSRP